MSDGSEIGVDDIIPERDEDFLGSLWSWGSNVYGQLGHSETDLPLYQPTPKQLSINNEKNTNWNSFSCGVYHAAATVGHGKLYTWGSSDFGQNGRNNLLISRIPEEVESINLWSQVVCGDYFTLALSTDHHLYGFGKNDAGQLGTGDKLFHKTPKQISNLYFEKFSCGANYSCGISTTGNLYTWGNNSHRQLGVGSTKNQLSPIKVDNNIWYKVSAGVFHTLAILKSDFSLWGWGLNNYNQLGIPDPHPITPVLIDRTHQWRQISCGIYHSLAVDKLGNLYSTGYGIHGQLGLKDQENKSLFTKVGDVSGVDYNIHEDNSIKFVDIGSVGYFSYGIGFTRSVLTRNNDLYFFGDNTYKLVQDQPQYILEPYIMEKGFAKVAKGNCGGVFVIAVKMLETVGGDR